MKNLIAFALAGLLAVSTATSVPPTISESLSDSVVVSESSSVSEVPVASSSSKEGAISSPELPPVPESDDESVSGEPLPDNNSVPAESETASSTDSSVSTDSSTPTESTGPEDVAIPADSNESLDLDAEIIAAEDAQEAPQESEPARFSADLCHNLADEQASSLMGHYGLERSTASATIAATLVLADYEVSDDLDRNYAMAWAALQSAVEALAAEGHTAANCIYTDGAIILMK